MRRHQPTSTLFPYTTLFRSPAKDKPETQAFSVTGSFTSNLEFADPEKKKAFVESITNGNFHNQAAKGAESARSEEHTSELQSLTNLVCRLLLEKKNNNKIEI